MRSMGCQSGMREVSGSGGDKSVKGVEVIKVSEERGESSVRGAAGKPGYLDKPGHRGPEDDVRDDLDTA